MNVSTRHAVLVIAGAALFALVPSTLNTFGPLLMWWLS